MNREELIEEAAKAMHRAVYGGSITWPDTGKHIRDQWMAVARPALAVFEQAHTPTDDELLDTYRDAVARIAKEAAESVGGYAHPGYATYDAAWRAASAAMGPPHRAGRTDRRAGGGVLGRIQEA